MADLFSMKTPLAIQFPDGSKKIMVSYFPHPQGLVFLEPFWNQKPEGQRLNLLTGTIKGDGPWKIENCVISVLGCHGTDAELANQFSDWQFYLQAEFESYPSDEELARSVSEHIKNNS